MPKRFTDTEKWKKPFIRSLDGPYKLLWMYIVDDCDHAGIWQVDFEVARIRIGQDVNYETAERLFGERIVKIEKFKWFIPDFVTFQYGELSEKNRLHQSVIFILNKYGLRGDDGASKGLPRAQGKGQGIGQGQEKGTIPGKIEIFESIFNDQIFMGDLAMAHRGRNFEQAFEECWMHHSQTPNPPIEVWQWKQKLNTWLTIGKSNGNGTHKNGTNGSAGTSALVEGYKQRHADKFKNGTIRPDQ